MRNGSACFLAHPGILLDDVEEVKGSQEGVACGGTSHHS